MRFHSARRMFSTYRSSITPSLLSFLRGKYPARPPLFPHIPAFYARFVNFQPTSPTAFLSVESVVRPAYGTSGRQTAARRVMTYRPSGRKRDDESNLQNPLECLTRVRNRRERERIDSLCVRSLWYRAPKTNYSKNHSSKVRSDIYDCCSCECFSFVGRKCRGSEIFPDELFFSRRKNFERSLLYRRRYPNELNPRNG